MPPSTMALMIAPDGGAENRVIDPVDGMSRNWTKSATLSTAGPK
jgi:hypothetical protein